MEGNQKKLLVGLGALVLVAIVAGIMMKNTMAPAETVTDFKRVPPKGIGKADRE